jgi:hypothetical protein
MGKGHEEVLMRGSYDLDGGGVAKKRDAMRCTGKDDERDR